MTSTIAASIVLTFAIAGVLGALTFFSLVQIHPPRAGVLNLFDVALMVALIVVMPYLFLSLPSWLLTISLAAGIASVLGLALEPVLAQRAVRWTVIWVAIAAELLMFSEASADSHLFHATNNVVIVAATIATANLWAQAGFNCRRAAALSVTLAVYDILFTTVFGVTDRMFEAAIRNPFPPMISWPVKDGALAVGEGDLVLACLFPLVTLKAFGRPASLAVAASTVAAFVLLVATTLTGSFDVAFPIMAVLGPLHLTHWIILSRRHPVERTTAQFRST